MRKSYYLVAIFVGIAGLILAVKYTRFYFVPKNFNVVEPNLFRGGKQTDRVFQQLLDTYKIKTVISLTGEFKEQEKAASASGARYLFYNWRGSGIGPFDEYKVVGKLLADPASRPAFFHCYAGDKRSNATTFAVSLEEGLSVEQAFARLEQFSFSKSEDAVLYQHLKEYAEWREIQLKDSVKPPSQASTIPSAHIPVASHP